jgi:hypothetical protein
MNGSGTGFIFPPPQANKFLICLFLCRALATLVYSLRRFILNCPRVRKIKGGYFVVSEINYCQWNFAQKAGKVSLRAGACFARA